MRRRSLMGAIAGAAITLGLIAPQLAASAPRQDPRAEREQVRAEQAKLAAELNTNKASEAEINKALNTLSDNLRTQEAALARTEAEVAQAEQDVADAEAAIKRLKGEISTLRDEIRRRAVAAYVNPPQDDVFTVLDTNDFVTASSRKFYIELRSQDDADVNDRLNGAVSQMDYQRRKAEAARKEAAAKRAEQAQRTDAVRQAKAQKQKLADKIQATISTQIDRSVELAATDRALSKKIAEQQAALVAKLAAQKAADEAARQKARQARAAAAAAAAQAPPPSNQSPTGAETTPLPPLPPVSTGPSGTGTGGISLCTVGGITVNCAIKVPLQNMLNAAASAGVSLSGGGYRDPASQIRLRQAHCGSSYYAIYQMSASSCRPPTARPGTSQHEIGLAIDFSNCSSRGSACYRWLAANAAGFGFYNLPSEPWHWSTTGS